MTGCAGFIGSHLAERLLSEGAEVTGLDNFDDFYDRSVKEANLAKFSHFPKFNFLEIDLRNKPAVRSIMGNFDVVIHLAAKAGVLPSLRHADDYIAVNITGTNHLLEFMKTREIKKMVFASSSSVYGNNAKIPFSEEDAVDTPISPYAFTKRSCELMNHSYHHLYNFDIINLRLFTVYGPRQRPDLAIHKFTKLIDEGHPVPMYGDGSTSRDYTYVADTVDGLVKAMNYVLKHEGVFEIMNLGNNQPVSLKTLVETIYKYMGKQPNIHQMPMQPGDVNVTYADISKAARMLDYHPQTNFELGISSFIQWYYEQQQEQQQED